MIKVLIVEDEDMIRKGLIYTIDWLSMDCVVVADASNGAEGLQMIEEHRPDLVITDIIMPKMDGIRMLELAQTQHSTSFFSIFLTSYSEFDYAKKAIALGVFDYVLKPVDENELKDVVGRVKKEIEHKQTVTGILEFAEQTGELQLIDSDIFINPAVRKNFYVSFALNEIHEHYMNKISIEAIAEELGVSPSYLSRKFKELLSQTFLDVLNKYRVQKAAALLRQGSYRIYEVSDKTGFTDYKHFCSVFKKYTDLSPSDFAKSVGCLVHKNPQKK